MCVYVCVCVFLTSVGVGSKRPLVLHHGLSELQQLSVFFSVHPPQVVHVLDHHLHRLPYTTLLEGGGVTHTVRNS